MIQVFTERSNYTSKLGVIDMYIMINKHNKKLW